MPGIVTMGSVEELDLATWRRTMAVNADSAFLGSKYALPLMRVTQPGSIINMSSISGLIAGHNLAAYNASKAAVWMLSKIRCIALRAERLGYQMQFRAPDFCPYAIAERYYRRTEHGRINGQAGAPSAVGPDWRSGGHRRPRCSTLPPMKAG